MEAAVGGQAPSAPFPSRARPTAQILPPPKRPAFPFPACLLRLPPRPWTLSLPTPGLLRQFSEAERQRAESGEGREAGGGRATVPKMAEAEPAGKGEMLEDPILAH